MLDDILAVLRLLHALHRGDGAGRRFDDSRRRDRHLEGIGQRVVFRERVEQVLLVTEPLLEALLGRLAVDIGDRVNALQRLDVVANLTLLAVRQMVLEVDADLHL